MSLLTIFGRKVFLVISSDYFSEKHDFDYFDFILFKILFFEFVYLLLDRITHVQYVYLHTCFDHFPVDGAVCLIEH